MTNVMAITVRIVEPLDQEGIDRLVDALGLDSRGSLDDDWDYEFGSKDLKGEGAAATEVILWRNDEQPWHLEVTHPEDETPTAEELAGWRKEIIDGIKTAGLTPVPSE